MTDSSAKYYEMTIRVITFSGKKKDWIAWEEKFLAKSKRRGYKDVLLGKATIPKSTESLDPDDPDEENSLKFKDSMNQDTPTSSYRWIRKQAPERWRSIFFGTQRAKTMKMGALKWHLRINDVHMLHRMLHLSQNSINPFMVQV
jgi:hypothetical protein